MLVGLLHSLALPVRVRVPVESQCAPHPRSVHIMVGRLMDKTELATRFPRQEDASELEMRCVFVGRLEDGGRRLLTWATTAGGAGVQHRSFTHPSGKD